MVGMPIVLPSSHAAAAETEVEAAYYACGFHAADKIVFDKIRAFHIAHPLEILKNGIVKAVVCKQLKLCAHIRNVRHCRQGLRKGSERPCSACLCAPRSDIRAGSLKQLLMAAVYPVEIAKRQRAALGQCVRRT